MMFKIPLMLIGKEDPWKKAKDTKLSEDGKIIWLREFILKEI
jgi:hypothetical protein